GGGQGVLGDGHGDPADQPAARRWPVAGPARAVAGQSPAGDAGDGEGVPGGVGDDDPPLGGGVVFGDLGELAGLGGGDGTDAAQGAGPFGQPGQGGPGQQGVQQPGHRPAAGAAGRVAAGRGGRDRAQRGPGRHGLGPERVRIVL